MKNKKIEGYWFNEYSCPEYPMPEADVLTQEEADKIFQLIKEKEKTAHVTHYKGFTTSRITGEKLGSTEFQNDEWTWPVDFAPHYVRDHRVKPSDEFLKYIRYNG